MDSNILVS
ncbi:unnamed protein product [Candida parapsilosis]